MSPQLVCECCMSNETKSLLQLSRVYKSSAGPEVYREMLSECFNIIIPSYSHGGMICEGCSARLRDAHNFRRQVLNVQRNLKEQNQPNDDDTDVKALLTAKQIRSGLSDNTRMKMESCKKNYIKRNRRSCVKLKMIPEEEGEPMSPEADDPAPDSPEYTPEYKQSANTKKERRVRSNRIFKQLDYASDNSSEAMTSNSTEIARTNQDDMLRKKAKIIAISLCDQSPASTSANANAPESVYVSSKDVPPGVTNFEGRAAKAGEKSFMRAGDIQLKKLRMLPTLKKNKIINKLMKLSKTTSDDPVVFTVNNSDALLNNVAIVLACSNATPFRGYYTRGFRCYYCNESFGEPRDLRTHSHQHDEERHSGVVTVNANTTFDSPNFFLYLDVKDLKCTICDENIENLNVLKKHLAETHDALFLSEVGDRCIPFCLDNSECTICSKKFVSFRSLVFHMNVHYPNSICRVCSEGFITEKRLKNHMQVHMNGAYRCSHCDKTFISVFKLRAHEVSVHYITQRFRCPRCGDKFYTYSDRQMHLVKKHGAVEPQFKCKLCVKKFKNNSILNTHLKKVHWGERAYVCNVCGYEFFQNTELVRHMSVHIAPGEHKCSICNKMYARAKSLREHVRVFHTDGQCMCHVCGKKFVSEGGLSRHILIIHPDVSYSKSDEN